MSITQEVLESILRIDLKSFVIKVFHEIAGGSVYLDNWHIDLICSEILNLINNKNDRLIINMPPRYLKSMVGSVALPAFLLGLNPKAVIMCVAYNDELASKLAYDCKKIMESQWYKELFPKTRLAKNRFATMDFETTMGGGRYASSVGGTITGRGADWIIIDDPIKPADALSELLRTKTNEFYSNTLSSRLNDKEHGKIILIMQRLHEDDLTGHLLNADLGFKLLKLQGIAEYDEEWKINRPFGKVKTVTRKKGEALHPERESLKQLLTQKREMGTSVFAGQYQQDPMPLEGGIIKIEWMQYYSRAEFFRLIEKGEIKIEYLVQSWDTAYGTNNNNDYSACVTYMKDSLGNIYILDVFRGKLEFPDLIRKIVRMEKDAKEKYKKSVDVLIEGKGPGLSLIQELKQNHNLYPKKIDPEYDKQARLLAVSHLIENGRCRFPDDNPYWWSDFEKELLTFPNGKHDDQCDALSQALNVKLSCGIRSCIF